MFRSETPSNLQNRIYINDINNIHLTQSISFIPFKENVAKFTVFLMDVRTSKGYKYKLKYVKVNANEKCRKCR